MAGLGLPHAALREQVADAFDLVVCQARAAPTAAPRGRRRRGGPGRRRPGRARDLRLARRPRRALASAAPLATGCAGARCGAAARDRGAAAPYALRPARLRRRAAGVLGAWEALAAIERSRVVAALERASSRSRAPAARAARRRGPSAAGWRCSRPARWPPPAGCSAALRSALRGGSRPAARARGRAGAAAPLRRRRAARSAGAARALADALGAGHSIRGAIAGRGGGVPGAGRPRARAPPPARSRSATRPGPCSSACVAAPPARRGTRSWPAILLQRDAGGDLAGLLRELAAALEAAERARARRPRRDRPGALHRAARAAAPARRRRARGAREPGLTRRPVEHPLSRSGSRRGRRRSRRRRSWPSRRLGRVR